MESEASWALLGLALALVLGLTAVVAWLSVTEVRAVTPAPATVRRRGLDPRGRSTDVAGGDEA